MKLDELKNLQATLKQQFDNLSDPQWIHTQREQIRGKFDILTEVINSLEGEQDATTSTKRRTNSPNNSGK